MTPCQQLELPRAAGARPHSSLGSWQSLRHGACCCKYPSPAPYHPLSTCCWHKALTSTLYSTMLLCCAAPCCPVLRNGVHVPCRAVPAGPQGDARQGYADIPCCPVLPRAAPCFPLPRRAVLCPPDPQALKEMRVKGMLVDHKEVHAAIGVKIVAPGLETAVAGTQLYVIGPEDDEEELKETVMEVRLI